MSEDIHKWTDGRYALMFDEHTFFVWDNEKEERMTALEVTKKLNEQQATIRRLQDLCGKSDGENMKLRIENKRLKEENKELEDEHDDFSNFLIDKGLEFEFEKWCKDE